MARKAVGGNVFMLGLINIFTFTFIFIFVFVFVFTFEFKFGPGAWFGLGFGLVLERCFHWVLAYGLSVCICPPESPTADLSLRCVPTGTVDVAATADVAGGIATDADADTSGAEAVLTMDGGVATPITAVGSAEEVPANVNMDDGAGDGRLAGETIGSVGGLMPRETWRLRCGDRRPDMIVCGFTPTAGPVSEGEGGARSGPPLTAPPPMPAIPAVKTAPPAAGHSPITGIVGGVDDVARCGIVRRLPESVSE